MKKYDNKHGCSSVFAYEYGEHWIRVQFTSGIIRTYTYQNVGWLNVESMKKCADSGSGLSSYIYGPFGYSALVQRVLYKMPWLRRFTSSSISKKYIKYPIVTTKKGMNYQRSLSVDENALTQNSQTLANEIGEKEKKRRGIFIMFDEGDDVQNQNVCSENSGVPSVVLKKSCCVARLLYSELKNMPETA